LGVLPPPVQGLVRSRPCIRGPLERARELDAFLARTGRFVGSLHGVPLIVKDNYDTHDLPTTAGSLTLKGSVPPDDGYQIRRVREEGAIVLAKANMAEFALSPYETVGSLLPGYTRNPYATNRVTAGSSGGTAAAVAAVFGTVGLGTDTGNSIRGPASHQALVGIRSTMGLTSRDGIVPLYLDRDVGGPMARSVADAVAVLDVIAGYDPADPVTAALRERPLERYSEHLRPDGLEGKRRGVVRAFAAYLESLGPGAPVRTLDEIVRRGDYHPSRAARRGRATRDGAVRPPRVMGKARGDSKEEKDRRGGRKSPPDLSASWRSGPAWPVRRG